MTFIVTGAGGQTNFSINDGAAVRFSWGWSSSPAGRNCVVMFAMPPSIHSGGARVVSYNNAVDQSGPVVLYTVDVRGETSGSAFQVGGGGLT